METDNLFEVKDKVVVVTGGGRGVGEHIAEAFIANGAKVYIIGRKELVLEKTCCRLNAMGKGECYAIPSDLANYESLQKIVEDLKHREKKIHVLVNNAGAAWGSELEDITPTSYQRVMDLNLKSLLFLTLGLLPQLKAAGSNSTPSRIINIGSTQGIVTGNNIPVYDASKVAVHHITKALARQLAANNVLINAIALGMYETSMTKGLIEAVGRENALSTNSLGRSGRPHEIAGLSVSSLSRIDLYGWEYCSYGWGCNCKKNSSINYTKITFYGYID